jgi:phosphoribosylpyrophosphate synthetase
MPEGWSGRAPLPSASMLGLAIIDKRRSAPNKAKAMAVIGEVKDKTVIIQDDMIDTAGTLTEAVNALIAKGAREVHACCAHPVISGLPWTGSTNHRLPASSVRIPFR